MSEGAASGHGPFTPTREQQRLLDKVNQRLARLQDDPSARETETDYVVAFPGAGKTSLLHYGLRDGGFQLASQKRVLFLQFNRSHVDTANETHGDNPHIRFSACTVHTLLNNIARKVCYNGQDIKVVTDDDLRKAFSKNHHYRQVYEYLGYDLSPGATAKIVASDVSDNPLDTFKHDLLLLLLQTVLIWCNLTDKQFTDEFVEGLQPTREFLEKYGLSYGDVDFTYLANRFWNLSRTRYATEIPILHDVYAKNALLALEADPSNARLVYFDMLILDEAQDFTPMQFAAIQIIRRMHRRAVSIVMCDPYQRLYGFKSAFTYGVQTPDLHNAHVFTHSFRFGQNIAAIANLFILLIRFKKGEIAFTRKERHQNLIRGCKAGRSIVVHGDSNISHLGPETHAIVNRCRNIVLLARANSTLIEACLRTVVDPPSALESFYFAFSHTKLSTNFMQALQAIKYIVSLKTGTHETPPVALRDVANLDEAEAFSNQYTGDIAQAVEYALTKVYTASDENLQELVDRITTCTNNDGHTRIQVSTVHSYKGLESDVVVLADDFSYVFDRDGKHLSKTITEEELYIMYVAVTRARRALVLCSRLTETVAIARTKLGRDDPYMVGSSTGDFDNSEATPHTPESTANSDGDSSIVYDSELERPAKRRRPYAESDDAFPSDN